MCNFSLWSEECDENIIFKRPGRRLSSAMILVTIRTVVIVGLVAAAIIADAQTVNETEIAPTGGLSVYVRNKGADIRFYRSLGSGGKTDQITVKFSEIREVESDGKVVSGSTYNLSDQDFTVSGQYDGPLPNSVGVMARSVTLNTSLPAGVGAELQLQVYTILTGGNVTLGDETSTVFEGQLKVTVEVGSWNWSASGAFVEVDIVVKIPPGKQLREKNDTDGKHPKMFSFGEGATANFSKKVQVDGGPWQDMATGYPKLSQNGANNIITLRLPRFNTSAIYDPTFDAGTDVSSVTSKGSFVVQSYLTLGILCCLMLMLRGVL